jgi:hypothetical protein
METAMTAYTRQDLIDSFYCSASLYDPDPTEAQLDELLAIALKRYGKHPCDLSSKITDELVWEIVNGRAYDPFEDFNYVGSRHHY